METIKKFQTSLPASPMGFETLTITASVVRPNLALVELCRFAVIRFQGGSARFKEDGTNPTAVDGAPVFDLQEEQYSVASLRQIRFIRTGSVNCTAYIRYYF